VRTEATQKSRDLSPRPVYNSINGDTGQQDLITRVVSEDRKGYPI
jgi:hypothetical protein